MKKILIMCYPDPERSPRPNRMINWLKSEYQLTVVAQNTIKMEGIESLAIYAETRPKPAAPASPLATGVNPAIVKKPSKWAKRIRKGLAAVKKIRAAIKRSPAWVKTRRAFILYFRLLRAVADRLKLIKRDYEEEMWLRLGRARELQKELAEKNFDLIITHDLTLMPLACGVRSGSAKILLDVREYHPRNYDDQWQWRLLTKPILIHLCEEYLHRCDKIITVSDGLAQEYAKEFHVYPEVVMSLPPYQDLSPVQTADSPIRIVHHGSAGASRKIELMIEMMDFIDERFSLDLMLLAGKDKYWDKIVSMVNKRKNVRLVPSVPMNQIVSLINQYDIGLFICPPTNFNLTFALPNKLFEFIQARLMVAIGPSIEMKKIVEEYDCGVVSSDFKPETLAKELNKLTTKKVMYYKGQSHKAASVLNEDINRRRIHEIVGDLIAG